MAALSTEPSPIVTSGTITALGCMSVARSHYGGSGQTLPEPSHPYMGRSEVSASSWAHFKPSQVFLLSL
jgi:hypothetical protein